jgi:hypothetical protein
MTPSRAPEWLGDGPRVPVAYTYMNGRECYALALGSTGTHPINCRQGPLVGRADRSEPNASAPRAAGQLDWTVGGGPRPGGGGARGGGGRPPPHGNRILLGLCFINGFLRWVW